jgi:hypothetical protein
MLDFHVRCGDKVLGPFSPRKIKQMIADGKIKPYDRIRVEGDDQWNTIGDIPNLAKCFRARSTRKFRDKSTLKPVPRPSADAATRKTNRLPQRTQVPAMDARRGDCSSPLNIHAALNARCPSCGECVNEGYARCHSCNQEEIAWVTSTIAYAAENKNLAKKKGAFHVGPCLPGQENAAVLLLDNTVRDFNSTKQSIQMVGMVLGGIIALACFILCGGMGGGRPYNPTPSRQRSSDAEDFSSELIKMEREWQNTPASQKRTYSRP